MKIGLVSLGCPKNLVDSEVMLGLAQEAGYELATDPAEADILVVNTCAFIEGAKKESIDAILELAGYKQNGRCRRLLVTGCLAERHREELAAEIPEIDAVLGTGEVPRIVAAIEGVPSAAAQLAGLKTRATSIEPCEPGEPRAPGGPQHPARRVRHATLHSALPTRHPRPGYLNDADTPRVLATPSHYAYVKIAEGCNHRCGFCIIPALRGRYRSRSAESIVTEARSLAERGVRELLLISQDATAYGSDRHERAALAGLLRRLDTIDRLEWIRLLYLHPATIGPETLDAIGECIKVCKYIDLPLQHASDSVLRRMKRPGSRSSYDALLSRIRAAIPGVALRTTFIVGFPGETDADVDELCEFVTDHWFDHVGVFTYSHEEGTAAFSLRDNVASRTKAARRNRVMRVQRERVTRRQRERVGERVRLMIDGPARDHDWVLTARLASQAPEIDSCVYLTDCDPSTLRTGQVVEAEIVGAREYDLIARVRT
jgi:ribosomal protein S12 methylthiotransferase